MMDEPFNPIIIKDDGSGCCSRCGMAYGGWELTVKWESSQETKIFNHLVGCRWTVGTNKKDFGPQLRETGVVPSNANIIRFS